MQTKQTFQERCTAELSERPVTTLCSILGGLAALCVLYPMIRPVQSLIIFYVFPVAYFASLLAIGIVIPSKKNLCVNCEAKLLTQIGIFSLIVLVVVTAKVMGLKVEARVLNQLTTTDAISSRLTELRSFPQWYWLITSWLTFWLFAWRANQLRSEHFCKIDRFVADQIELHTVREPDEEQEQPSKT